MNRLYYVERTDCTGHWRVHGVTTTRREALQDARYLAYEPRDTSRRRVMVRVRASHEMPDLIAGWINGHAAWGESF